MAETKQEKRTFKWGDSEYLLDDLLKLHAEQEQNFYNFARAKGSYDDAALTGLRNALTNRINAAKSGKTFSADGLLDTDTVDNTSIQTQKKGLFKKEKYVEQDNTEWAKYYLNKLVGQLKPYQREDTTSSKDWDISKHGFEAYLKGQGLDARDIFEKYDLRDKNDPDAARSYTQRDEQLRKHLGNYKTWLETKGFDFTKNDNEWDDNYMSTLDSVINGDWTDRAALAASLRKLGAGNYALAFTSDKWDLSKSDEELTEEAKKRKEEADAKQKQAYMDEFENFAYDHRRPDKPTFYNGYDGDFSMDWYGDLNAAQQSEYGTYLGRDNQAWTNAWTNLMNSLKSGRAYSDKNAGVLLQGTFLTQNHGFIDLGDGKYLIRDSVTDNGQGTVYDPNTGYTNTVFLGDLAGNNSEILNIYRQLAYKYANSKYGTKYEDRPNVLRNGGELVQKYQYGNAVVYNWDTPQQAAKAKAQANGVSVETQKARDQYLDKDNKSIDNPDAGFRNLTFAQKARIGYAIADLTSAVAAFAPGIGTGVAVGASAFSTFGNFVSDLSDDAVTKGQAWKNLGMNLGMDVLGLIPGGGAASKMGKVLKSLKTIVPTIIALPGVVSMLKNSPEIAASWKKAFDGDSDEGGSKMNYQDYMNILQVLNVVTAGATIAKNKIQSSKVSIKHSDKLAVDVLDSNNQRRALILEGDDISKFKEANAKGEAQKFIDELEGKNVYTINETSSFNKGKFWGKNKDGKFEFFHQSPVGQSKTGQANTLEVKFDSRKGTFYADTGKWQSDLGLNDGELIETSKNYKARVKEIEGKIDNTVNELKTAMQRRSDKVKETTDRLTPEKTRLVALQEKLHGVPSEAELQAKRDQLQTTLNSNEQALSRKKQEVIQAEETLNQLLGRTGITQDEIATHNQALRSARGKVSGNKSALQGYEFTKQQVESDLANVEKQLDLHTQTQKTKATIARLESILNSLKSENHTNAYTRLQNMLEELKTAPAHVGGRSVNLDMAEILKKAGVKDAFQHGGSINRNKINKFLNYAKR